MIKAFLVHTVLRSFKLVLGKNLLIKLLYLYAKSTDTKMDDATAVLVDGVLNADKEKIEEGILWLFDEYINKGKDPADVNK